MEWQRFLNRCNVQREVLTAVVNKTLFAILLEQQQVLTMINFPRFTIDILEKFELILGELQSNIVISKTSSSSSSSQTQSQAQSTVGILTPQLIQQIEEQKVYICALLSLKVNVTPIADELSADGPRSIAMARRYTVNSQGEQRVIGGIQSSVYYYSKEAKLMRKAKRRRLSGQSQELSRGGYLQGQGQGQAMYGSNQGGRGTSIGRGGQQRVGPGRGRGRFGGGRDGAAGRNIPYRS